MNDEAQRPVSWPRGLLWSACLLALAVIANWPQQYGLPVGFFVRMGFPFRFAFWANDQLETLETWPLVYDLLIWGTAILVPLLAQPLRRRGSD